MRRRGKGRGRTFLFLDRLGLRMVFRSLLQRCLLISLGFPPKFSVSVTMQ